jgi:uncharacterized protein (TIGR02147 family)
MNPFEYEDYKKWVNDWVAAQPKGGHGQFRQLASYLKVNSVVMSQVFRGEREITTEQAVGLAKYMCLSEGERNFFLLLVQRARAGTRELTEIITGQMNSLRKRSMALKNRIKHSEFSEKERAIFYSHWYYSAVRLGVSIDGLNSIASLSDHLGLERSLVTKVVNFLLENKLILEKNKKLEMGPQVTHVGHDSPFVNRHHANWRLQGLQSMDATDEKQLFYTGTMALSRQAADTIRQELIRLIEKATKTAAESKSETLTCLNIDWFRV